MQVIVEQTSIGLIHQNWSNSLTNVMFLIYVISSASILLANQRIGSAINHLSE
jgi:hypothetical protein